MSRMILVPCDLPMAKRPKLPKRPKRPKRPGHGDFHHLVM